MQHAGETAQAFAQRMFLAAASDPTFFELLGGILMPAEAEPDGWTPVMAAQTGRFLSAVKSKADKQRVKEAVVTALASFFGTGLFSIKTSPKSST